MDDALGACEPGCLERWQLAPCCGCALLDSSTLKETFVASVTLVHIISPCFILASDNSNPLSPTGDDKNTNNKQHIGKVQRAHA